MSLANDRMFRIPTYLRRFTSSSAIARHSSFVSPATCIIAYSTPAGALSMLIVIEVSRDNRDETLEKRKTSDSIEHRCNTMRNCTIIVDIPLQRTDRTFEISLLYLWRSNNDSTVRLVFNWARLRGIIIYPRVEWQFDTCFVCTVKCLVVHFT